MSCQNYTDALNAALLKSLIFTGSSIKGRLFQITIVLGKNENIIVTGNLLKGMMIWKSGFSFIGHTSGGGGSLNPKLSHPKLLIIGETWLI